MDIQKKKIKSIGELDKDDKAVVWGDKASQTNAKYAQAAFMMTDEEKDQMDIKQGKTEAKRALNAKSLLYKNSKIDEKVVLDQIKENEEKAKSERPYRDVSNLVNKSTASLRQKTNGKLLECE